MSETKWTPGPRVIMESVDRDGYVLLAQPSPILRGFTKEVALYQHKEDAQLGLAAPELYEALKSITDCFGVGYVSAEKFVEDVTEFMNGGRAALSRARGEA